MRVAEFIVTLVGSVIVGMKPFAINMSTLLLVSTFSKLILASPHILFVFILHSLHY